MNVYLLAALFSLTYVFVTIEWIRRQKLGERYALLWPVLGITMTGFCVFPHLLDRLSRVVRVHYAPSLLFMFGLFFSLTILLHLTLVISKMERKLTRLTQEIALLRASGADTKGERDADDCGRHYLS